jgi:hypothetical protein
MMMPIAGWGIVFSVAKKGGYLDGMTTLAQAP